MRNPLRKVVRRPELPEARERATLRTLTVLIPRTYNPDAAGARKRVELSKLVRTDSARELNRTFLSALRKAEKQTTLRAEWTSDDGTSESFFDYVLKKTIKN